MPLGLEFGVGGPGNAEEMSELTAASPLAALTDVADNTETGTLHLISELAVSTELRKDCMCGLEDVHREVVDAKIMEACHV
jgi:hypothetical protein